MRTSTVACKRRGTYLPLAAFLFTLLILSAPASSATLTFAVNPVLPPKQTLETYRTLADYLSETTGHTVKLVTSSNLLVHWQLMKRGVYHLVLDQAHFTDYRVQYMDYSVLARFPSNLSYTLVTQKDSTIREVNDLLGKAIAGLPSPGLGVMSLAETFSNPMRQPVYVPAATTSEAAEKVLTGKAAAAIIPTPLAKNYPALAPLLRTDPMPGFGFSAASWVDEKTKREIKQALLNASHTEQGRAMLKAIHIAAFKDSSNKDFAGLEILLETVWGY